MKQVLIISALSLLCGCATQNTVKECSNLQTQSNTTWINAKGEVVCNDQPPSPTTWNMRSGAPYYMYPGYYNQGQWVETPAKIFGAVGVLPGTLVGTVLSIPLLPFYEFETTVESSNIFFGRGFSLILGSPFYVTKLILWDVPKSWFEE
ncbi:MAG: hypothetical protein ACRC37_00030 [Lentisphaeria bacterium]